MTTHPRPATLVTNQPRIELNQNGEIRAFNLSEDYHILGREPHQPSPIGLSLPQTWTMVSRIQACFRKIGTDYYIYDGDGESKPSSNGLFIKNRLIPPKEGYKLEHGDQISIGQNRRKWVTITYIDPEKVNTGTLPRTRTIPLANRSVVIGRDPTATLELDAPTISRHHATIDQGDGGRYTLTDYSTNGVFVNDQKVKGSIDLADGDSIRIGPYTFLLQRDELVLADAGDQIRIDAKNILLIKYRKKQPIRLLNNISLVIEPGQLVAIVGGSGSGKSTLIKTLLGLEAISQDNNQTPIERAVYLNGDNIRLYFNIYRTLIGYVPQQDIVHTNLTVYEVLYYAAKLRLPSDQNLNQLLAKTIDDVELSQRKDTLVKDLSGGQLKRVSIAVELLADPKLFFLDEPTSGLDPGLDKKMMQLLRRLANEGRTVILVTHATNNITLCDRLVFLGLGGNLCYFGTPDKALEFFTIDSGDFADIYIELDTPEAVATVEQKYHQSEYYKDYIENRLAQSSQKEHLVPQQVKAPFRRQLSVLIQRYVKLLVRDRVNLLLSLLTAPIGISLMTLAIREQTPFKGVSDATLAGLALKVLFVFTCAAIWVGLASSLQEIVKEAAIYMRERLVNLGLLAYLGSKVLSLGALAILQSVLITLVVLICFKAPSSPTLLVPWPVGVFITTFLTLMAAISLGLMVSASVKNITQANSALPILLLPQIIFAGVLFSMKGVSKFLSWLMIGRWSVGAYGTIIDLNFLIPPNPETTDVGGSYKLPLERSDVYAVTWDNLAKNWGILLLHITVYLLITYWLQKRKDVFKT
ncbi:FHA domain-containing protein [Gloeothece verrucosa]|uniref:FHA modulated ABC efflux pump with fused ATPase and integral membrane subunits n=1 Tax=Gloeothece verrucosa (strain PCC 7822) TaxID=497965 RepID=E0U527_GLOV7|nr:FHA domain-containing protein [Gloeothece verrucosa]ADN12306.1 FHA modulated ABC efflux pump with fused ATPase and integral membrane subunits [Gloeothece verrucosa PCC 7822]